MPMTYPTIRNSDAVGPQTIDGMHVTMPAYYCDYKTIMMIICCCRIYYYLARPQPLMTAFCSFVDHVEK